MKVKYNPCKWNPYSKDLKGLPDTEIKYINVNSIEIDGDLYEFDKESIIFRELYLITDGLIMEAYRDDQDELCITVRRFYTESCSGWDDGEYHDIKG